MRIFRALFFFVWVSWVLHLQLCVVVVVLFCSVWDALTDNYISTWDGNDPEGLNGNLSDQEVLSLTVCSIWIMCLVHLEAGICASLF